jgi:type VI secretion system protein ImpC
MKAMLRDMSDLQGIGRLEVERSLQDWLAGYTEPPAGAPNAFTGRPRPLEVAEVTVEELPEQPGFYNSRFYIRPRRPTGRGPA